MAGNYPPKLYSPIDRLQFDLADDTEDHLIAALRTHPDVRRHLPMFPTTMTTGDAAKLREFRASQASYGDYHVHSVDAQDGTRTFVGMAGFRNLEPFNKSVELGILLLPEYHRKAVGTETLFVMLEYLFEEQEMHRVSFETSTENVAMRGWFENVAGAKLEAIRRECWRDVENADYYGSAASYCILEQEWRGSVKERLRTKLSKLT